MAGADTVLIIESGWRAMQLKMIYCAIKNVRIQQDAVHFHSSTTMSKSRVISTLVGRIHMEMDGSIQNATQFLKVNIVFPVYIYTRDALK